MDTAREWERDIACEGRNERGRKEAACSQKAIAIGRHLFAPVPPEHTVALT